MVWVKIDDDFYQHPKVVTAGPVAAAMQVNALCHCNRNMTDGFVAQDVVPQLLDLSRVLIHGEPARWGMVVDALVRNGMWIPAEGGWWIHDYDEYQPVRALREKRSDAGRRGGLRSGEVRRSKTKNILPCSNCQKEDGRRRRGLCDRCYVAERRGRPPPFVPPKQVVREERSSSVPLFPRSNQEAKPFPRTKNTPSDLLFPVTNEARTRSLVNVVLSEGYPPDVEQPQGATLQEQRDYWLNALQPLVEKEKAERSQSNATTTTRLSKSPPASPSAPDGPGTAGSSSTGSTAAAPNQAAYATTPNSHASAGATGPHPQANGQPAPDPSPTPSDVTT